VAQVVDREEAVGQQLFGAEEVRQVGAAEAPTGAAIALDIDGLLLIKVSGVAQVEAAPGNPGLTIAGHPSWENRVEEVNTTEYRLEQVDR
jgi:hypothetical protein